MQPRRMLSYGGSSSMDLLDPNLLSHFVLYTAVPLSRAP